MAESRNQVKYRDRPERQRLVRQCGINSVRSGGREPPVGSSTDGAAHAPGKIGRQAVWGAVRRAGRWGTERPTCSGVSGVLGVPAKRPSGSPTRATSGSPLRPGPVPFERLRRGPPEHRPATLSVHALRHQACIRRHMAAQSPHRVHGTSSPSGLAICPAGSPRPQVTSSMARSHGVAIQRSPSRSVRTVDGETARPPARLGPPCRRCVRCGPAAGPHQQTSSQTVGPWPLASVVGERPWRLGPLPSVPAAAAVPQLMHPPRRTRQIEEHPW